MGWVIYDGEERNNFCPISNTRALADIKAGILSMKEKWNFLIKKKIMVLTEPYLQEEYGMISEGEHYFVDSRVIPEIKLVEKINGLNVGEGLSDNIGLFAFKLKVESGFDIGTNDLKQKIQIIHSQREVRTIHSVYDIIKMNEILIREDFEVVTQGRISMPLHPSSSCFGKYPLFIEDEATIYHATINTEAGPVYIGRNTVVMEGCRIRGPFSIGSNSVLKMNSAIYGGTSIGNNCVAGGEIKNSIIHANSNKAHDGYLGDSYIGEWCNLGAGTTNSNLKNTAGMVKIWNECKEAWMETGMKMGMIMGDYSRSAINSSFNTGTVVGVSANVFGDKLLPKNIPSFSWGLEERYVFEKVLKDIINWKKLKKQELSSSQTKIIHHLFHTL